MSANTIKRAPILALLKDVAESEHRLRHQAAFQMLCEQVGLEIVHEPYRVTVRDAEADVEAAKAEAAKAEEAKRIAEKNTKQSEQTPEDISGKARKASRR